MSEYIHVWLWVPRFGFLRKKLRIYNKFIYELQSDQVKTIFL